MLRRFWLDLAGFANTAARGPSINFRATEGGLRDSRRAWVTVVDVLKGAN